MFGMRGMPFQSKLDQFSCAQGCGQGAHEASGASERGALRGMEAPTEADHGDH